jgi:hypothetical protein
MNRRFETLSVNNPDYAREPITEPTGSRPHFETAPVDPALVVELVSALAGVHVQDLLDGIREHPIPHTKRVIAYLLHRDHGYSFPDIAIAMNMASHSSVVSMDRFCHKMRDEPGYIDLLANARKVLASTTGMLGGRLAAAFAGEV